VTVNIGEAILAKNDHLAGHNRTWLAERGRAQMTGTGSCVFASFENREQALAALEGLPPGWRGFVARGLDRSPLQERLAAERSRGSGRI